MIMVPNTINTLRGLLLGYSLVGLAACVQAGEYTALNGEKLTREQIQSALGVTPALFEQFKKGAEESELKGKFRFIKDPWNPQQPQVSVRFLKDCQTAFNLRAEKQPDGIINVYGSDALINPHAPSLRSLRARGLHEKHHVDSVHALHRRYYQEHNKSALISTTVGTGAASLPIIHGMLRRVCQPRFPLKAASLLGTAAALAAHTFLEHRNILTERSQEIDADEFMLQKGDSEIIKGALEDFATDSVSTALVAADEEAQLSRIFTPTPAKFMYACIQAKRNWYSTYESPQERLKRAIRSERGSKLDGQECEAVIRNIIKHFNEPKRLQKLATKHKLSPIHVKNIIEKAEESCLTQLSR